MSDILKRKNDHIELVLKQQQHQAVANPFDKYKFEHNALPEVNLADVDLSTKFLGFKLKHPFLISSMTGGPKISEKINIHLAEAAEELGIAMGVGSQRIAVRFLAQKGLNAEIRKRAPNIPIFANLGAAQLYSDFGIKEVRQAIAMIQADALILHFNPLQEALQKNGDTNWKHILSKIEQVTSQLECPVIVKEVGMGISAVVAERLVNAGVSAIDVAGSGGTSFSAVEGARAEDFEKMVLGQLFADWGIPTPEAILSVRKALPDVPLIASGGIRHGLDAAKALALGANLIGQAGSILNAAIESTDAVVEHFRIMAQTIRIAQFCSTGIPQKKT